MMLRKIISTGDYNIVVCGYADYMNKMLWRQIWDLKI